MLYPIGSHSPSLHSSCKIAPTAVIAGSVSLASDVVSGITLYCVRTKTKSRLVQEATFRTTAPSMLMTDSPVLLAKGSQLDMARFCMDAPSATTVPSAWAPLSSTVLLSEITAL